MASMLCFFSRSIILESFSEPLGVALYHPMIPSVRKNIERGISDSEFLTCVDACLVLHIYTYI